MYFINALHLTQIREVNALQHILLDKIAMDYSEDEMMQPMSTQNLGMWRLGLFLLNK